MPVLSPIVAFARVALAERRPRSASTASPEQHLLAAEAWLCRAQDARDDGGVSYGYSIRGGWRASYPETSGYIATTFFRLARDRGDPAYFERAVRIVRWLLAIQNSDGSFANPRFGKDGIVFDTGQVLFALVRGHELTGDPAMRDGARRAAEWLAGICGPDLRWTRREHLGTPHVYNARTAWALLCMNRLEPEARREEVARANLDWALVEQREGGLFEHCSFRPGEPPFTHTIAYTARGLLESGVLLREPRYIDGAERCARAILTRMRKDGHLPSTIATDGRATSTSCCLTGNCQFAIVWARLFALAGDDRFRQGALRTLDYVMSTQLLDTADANVRGGIKGSDPVWGRYAPLSFPNWASKFFVDAMWFRKGLAA